MTRSEKHAIMRNTSCDINRAKDLLNSAVYELERGGLVKDAEQLYKMILRVESFQNKYR